MGIEKKREIRGDKSCAMRRVIYTSLYCSREWSMEIRERESLLDATNICML